ncbi:hypothetical protein KKH05_00115 [Patescibacteria group bacterium]|nr:hypothetical protein [Patescibacteria group bacterium]
MNTNRASVTIRRKERSVNEDHVKELAKLLEKIVPEELCVKECIGIDTPFFDKSARNVPDVRIEILIIQDSLAGPEPFREKSLAVIKRRVLEADILPPGTKLDMVVQFGYFHEEAKTT